jgi:hypothetical protein
VCEKGPIRFISFFFEINSFHQVRPAGRCGPNIHAHREFHLTLLGYFSLVYGVQYLEYVPHPLPLACPPPAPSLFLKDHYRCNISKESISAP